MTVLSKETAAAQVQSLLDFYEFDLEDFTQEQKDALNTALRRFEKAVMYGKLEIDCAADHCTVKQHLKRTIPGVSNPIVYKEIFGQAKTALRDNMNMYEKIYAFAGVLSGEGSSIFLKMTGKDLSVAESFGLVFLQL
jgi:hypothetical protein